MRREPGRQRANPEGLPLRCRRRPVARPRRCGSLALSKMRQRTWFEAAVVASALLAPACSSSGAAGTGGAAAGDCPVDTRRRRPGILRATRARAGPMRQIPLPGGRHHVHRQDRGDGRAYQAFLASGRRLQRSPRPIPRTPAARPRPATRRRASGDLPGSGVRPAADLRRPVRREALLRVGGQAPLRRHRRDPARARRRGRPTKNQWMNACTSGGRAWPYGPDLRQPGLQHVRREARVPAEGRRSSRATRNARPPPGPYDQVFDLSGNVSEWVDASQEGADWPVQRCVIMGGSYVHYWGDVSCSGAHPRSGPATRRTRSSGSAVARCEAGRIRGRLHSKRRPSASNACTAVRAAALAS